MAEKFWIVFLKPPWFLLSARQIKTGAKAAGNFSGKSAVSVQLRGISAGQRRTVCLYLSGSLKGGFLAEKFWIVFFKAAVVSAFCAANKNRRKAAGNFSGKSAVSVQLRGISSGQRSTVCLYLSGSLKGGFLAEKFWIVFLKPPWFLFSAQ